MKHETLKKVKESKQLLEKDPDNMHNFIYAEGGELGDYTVLNRSIGDLKRSINLEKHKFKKFLEKILSI